VSFQIAVLFVQTADYRHDPLRERLPPFAPALCSKYTSRLLLAPERPVGLRWSNRFEAQEEKAKAS